MKLSVLTITYNHAPFIERAVRSALMQETDFDYEIVIGEDCSNDGTRDIVRRLASENPGKIRVIYHDQRVGLQQNFRRVYHECRGQYVAVLEGDDYWTSRTKLQRQVDCLDRRGDWVLSFHPARLVDETTNREFVYGPTEKKESYGLEDILKVVFVPACSIVYRNGVVREIPQWVSRLRVADWPMLILHAEHGRFGYIDEVMAVYRRHSGGVWSGASREERIRTIVDMYACVNEHFVFKYDPLIKVMTAAWVDAMQREVEQDERTAFSDRIRELTEERAVLWERIRELGEERAAEHTALWERIRELGEERAAEHTQLWARIQALKEEKTELVRQNLEPIQQVQALKDSGSWYPHLVDRVRKVVGTHVSQNATVVVVSKGDDALLELGGRQAWHFPQVEGGAYAGSNPADSAEAIAHVEALSARGAGFLVFPGTASWWLEHYGEFREYLERHAELVAYDDACVIFGLRRSSHGLDPRSPRAPRAGGEVEEPGETPVTPSEVTRHIARSGGERRSG